MPGVICVRIPTQIPGEKEFRLAGPLSRSQVCPHGPWGCRDERSVLPAQILYLAPKEAADRWECLEFEFQ